ncbi:MAG: phage tail assembly protein [Betaproteobacteria bacterium]|nr:phage tail assembly protein [Betaproteobacteria bacterium]
MDQHDLPEIVDEQTIELRRPVRFGEQDYTSLTLREPTAEQLAKAAREPGEMETLISLIHQVAAVPKGVVGRIVQRDLQECARFFGQFSPMQSPPSGESSEI